MFKRLEDLFISKTKQFHDKPAIISVDEDMDISYGKWFVDSRKIANYLLSLGDQAGDNIVVYMSNSYSFACVLFGVFLAGKTLIPINPKVTQYNLDFIIVDCKPLVAFLDLESLKNFKNTEVFNIVMHKGEMVSVKECADFLPQKRNDNAIIIYTSGSTSTPKGIVCPHKQVLFVVSAINSIIPNSIDERVLLQIIRHPANLPFSKIS